MESPNPKQRELKMEEPQKSGSSFCRHLCIWFFFHGDSWSGTASELLSELKVGTIGPFEYESWPKTLDEVCAYLDRHRQELRLAGLEVNCHNQESALRLIKISWVNGIRRHPSEPMEAKHSEMSKSAGVSNQAESAHADSGFNNSPYDERQVFRKAANFNANQQRGKILRVALLSLIVVLIVAVVVFGSRHWRTATVLRP